MKKLLSMALAIALAASSFVCTAYAAEETITQTIQDFEGMEVGELDVKKLKENLTAEGIKLTDNVFLQSDHSVYPSIVENMYGQTGKSMKIGNNGVFSTSATGDAEYTSPIKMYLPVTSFSNEKATYSVNLYIPKLSDGITMQIAMIYELEGYKVADKDSKFIEHYTYLKSDGKMYKDMAGTTLVSPAGSREWYPDNWNTVSVGCDGTDFRYKINDSNALQKPAYDSSYSGKAVNAYIRIRLYNEDGSSTPITDWYLIDDFVKTNEGWATFTSLKSFTAADTKTAVDINTATAAAVKIAENGATTVVENAASVKEVTHVMQKLTNGAARLAPMQLTGTLTSATDTTDKAYYVADGRNYNIGQLGNFIKVGDLRKSLDKHSSSPMSIMTKDGVCASDDMLVNDSMKAVFTDKRYTEEYKISPQKISFADWSTKDNCTEGLVTIGEDARIDTDAIRWLGKNTDATWNTNVTVERTKFSGMSGYKFKHSGTGTSPFVVLRTTANAMQEKIMTRGAKTVVEYTIKPETLAYYSVYFRWGTKDGDNIKLTNEVTFHSSVAENSGMTFMPDGTIRLGGGDDSLSGLTNATQIGTYETGKEYRVQLVLKTPQATDTAFYVDSVWINGVKCAENVQKAAWINTQSFTQLGEVDFAFIADSSKTDKSFAVNLGGVNCYTADYFTPDAYLPADVAMPTGEKYANDAFVGTKTFKTGEKTVAELLSGLNNDNVALYVTDADNRQQIADSATLAEGMKLHIASMDGKAEKDCYTLSFVTDFGKLSATKADDGTYTLARSVKHYKADSEKMKLYAATYDSENRVVDCVASQEKTLTGYGESSFSVEIKPDEGQAVRLFMWNDDFAPYLDVLTATDGVVSGTEVTNQ